MPRVLIGNDSPTGAVMPDGTPAEAAITVVDLPPIISLSDREDQGLDGVTRDEAMATIADLWSHHSGSRPGWIETDDAGLAQTLVDRFGCPDKRPKKWSGLGDDITI